MDNINDLFCYLPLARGSYIKMSRIDFWDPKPLKQEIIRNGMKRLEKAAEVVKGKARSNPVISRSTVTRPMYKTGRYAGQFWTARDAGALKKSIRVVKKRGSEKLNIRVYAGTAKVHYACIYDSGTSIKTNEGFKAISSIKEGDFVIGQDGLPHKVLLQSSFPAKEKPNLIKLTVEWRSDRQHILTVTDDHKILMNKNGVSFWSKAKDLEVGDHVFSPMKIPHNKGLAEKNRNNYICENCQKEFLSVKHHGRKYGSIECRNEYWYKKGFNPHIGMKRSIESRQLMKEKAIKRFKENPQIHPVILAKLGYRTDAEKQVEKWIKEIGLKYQRQFKIGERYIDFAIPETGLLIEADGAYWHQDQLKDIERDKEIMAHVPDWTLIHLHFTNKRFSKIVDSCPLPNVYYLQCNNSMNSFVDMSYFKSAKIVKKERLVYGESIGIGIKPALLYDLAIEDVHSFIANGIIVSNSIVEFYTPYLRKALNASKSSIKSIMLNG